MISSMESSVPIGDMSVSDVSWDDWRVPKRDLLLMSAQLAPEHIVFGYMMRSAVAMVANGTEPFVFDESECGFESSMAVSTHGHEERLEGVEWSILRSYPSFGCHYSGLLICSEEVADWPSADIQEGATRLKVGNAKNPVDTGAGTGERDGYVHTTVMATNTSPTKRRVVPTLITTQDELGLHPITMQYTNERALQAIIDDPLHNLRRAPMRIDADDGSDYTETEEFGRGLNHVLEVVGVSIVGGITAPNALVVQVQPTEYGPDSQEEAIAHLTHCDMNGFGTYDVRARRLFSESRISDDHRQKTLKRDESRFAPSPRDLYGRERRFGRKKK